MSRIDDLIAELCPEGVEFVELGKLLAYEQPTKYLVDSTAYSDSYATPVLTAGQTFVLGRTDETNGIYPASTATPVIIFDDFTTAFKWVDFPFKAKSSAMKMLTPKEAGRASLRYIYYVMQTIRYEPQDHARQWIGVYSGFQVPVPPLEVQREIVRVLDQFTQLEAELEAELEARRRQYEHYRSELFDYSSENVAFKAFTDVGTFSRGGGPQKKDFVESGVGCIHYGQIYTHYGVSASVTNKFVDQAVAIKSKCADSGDVIIAVTSENDDDLARSVAWLGEGSVAVSNHTLIFKSDMDPRFVSHFLRTRQFDAAKRKYISGTKVKSLPLRAFEDIGIPVPPMQEQRRLADTLDKFDALVNDLSVGLPAELAARRKQYEYYRDRLLTFKELAA